MAHETRPLSSDECELRRDLKLRLLGLAAIEHARCQQASRMICLKGDVCTHFSTSKLTVVAQENSPHASGRVPGNLHGCMKKKNIFCMTISFASLEQGSRERLPLTGHN
jgi:hypothetical protein